MIVKENGSMGEGELQERVQGGGGVRRRRMYEHKTGDEGKMFRNKRGERNEGQGSKGRGEVR